MVPMICMKPALQGCIIDEWFWVNKAQNFKENKETES